jgi:hypothetical protein
MQYHTRNFKEFKGSKFTEGSTSFEFLMNHPKKEGLFIYKVVPHIDADAELIRDWFVSGWDVKAALKTINKAKVGKLEGFSKTTCSGYSLLRDGRRVRISDHEAIAIRSKSDVEFITSYRRGEIYLNGEIVFQATKNSTSQDLYNALANAF